jgi:hypothetical protein
VSESRPSPIPGFPASVFGEHRVVLVAANQPFGVPSEFRSPDSARCPVSGEQFDPYFDRSQYRPVEPLTDSGRSFGPIFQKAAIGSAPSTFSPERQI